MHPLLFEEQTPGIKRVQEEERHCNKCHNGWGLVQKEPETADRPATVKMEVLLDFLPPTAISNTRPCHGMPEDPVVQELLQLLFSVALGNQFPTEDFPPLA